MSIKEPLSFSGVKMSSDFFSCRPISQIWARIETQLPYSDYIFQWNAEHFGKACVYCLYKHQINRIVSLKKLKVAFKHISTK